VYNYVNLDMRREIPARTVAKDDLNHVLRKRYYLRYWPDTDKPSFNAVQFRAGEMGGPTPVKKTLYTIRLDQLIYRTKARVRLFAISYNG
jgi:hypothetical protein